MPVLENKADLEETLRRAEKAEARVAELESTAKADDEFWRNEVRVRVAEIQRLEAEIKEARNEAATVRRAYLHERWRADTACGGLATYDRPAADMLMRQSYQGQSVPSVGAEPQRYESLGGKTVKERVAEIRRQQEGVLDDLAAMGVPRPSEAPSDGARCRNCGHYETRYERAVETYAHCPSCGRGPHWLHVPNEQRPSEARLPPNDTPPKFKKGDHVISRDGEKGTVDSIWISEPSVRVKTLDNRTIDFRPTALYPTCLLGYRGCLEDHSAEDDVNVHQQRPETAVPHERIWNEAVEQCAKRARLLGSVRIAEDLRTLVVPTGGTP